MILRSEFVLLPDWIFGSDVLLFIRRIVPKMLIFEPVLNPSQEAELCSSFSIYGGGRAKIVR